MNSTRPVPLRYHAVKPRPSIEDMAAEIRAFVRSNGCAIQTPVIVTFDDDGRPAFTVSVKDTNDRLVLESRVSRLSKTLGCSIRFGRVVNR